MSDSQTPPPAPAPEGLNWRTIHGVVVVFVLALFLYSLQGLLNPFLLCLLFLFLVSPNTGSRHYVLLVSAVTVLTLIWLLQTTGFLLAPFFLAVVLAYIQHPLVRALERRGLSRNMAVLALAVPGVVVVGLIVAFGIPALAGQVANFIQNVPGYIQSLTLRVERWQLLLQTRDLPYVDEQAMLARLRSVQPEAVVAYLQERQSALAGAAWRGVLGVGKGVSSLLTLLSYVFLTPILVFYLLRDWDRITAGLAGLVPAAQQPRVLGFFREYDQLLAGYLRGNFLESAIVGVLTWLGYWILGVPYALLLGVVAGVFNVIPYMGLIVSLIPAVIIALFTANILLSLGKVFLVFIVVQLLDGSYIGPKIVGEAVGLHPVWIILALSVAGYFFGFVGLLLAVPLAVLVKLLLTSALARYRGSVLFQGGEAKIATGEPVGAEAGPAGA
ncbi:MAG TPA: AI-2E family transporter [Longimicrobiaceae bacterium]